MRGLNPWPRDQARSTDRASQAPLYLIFFKSHLKSFMEWLGINASINLLELEYIINTDYYQNIRFWSNFW